MKTIDLEKRTSRRGRVTPAALKRAVALALKDPGIDKIRASSVSYLVSRKALLVELADQSAIVLPVANYPEFADLSTAKLKRVAVGFHGSALCLEEQDLHVSIGGLIMASNALMDVASRVIATRNGVSTSISKPSSIKASGKKKSEPSKEG